MDVRISSHVRELSLSVGKKYSGGVQSLYRSKNLKLSCPCLKRHCDMLESNLSFGLSVKYQFFFYSRTNQSCIPIIIFIFIRQ